jgi:hypothetical protein
MEVGAPTHGSQAPLRAFDRATNVAANDRAKAVEIVGQGG